MHFRNILQFPYFLTFLLIINYNTSAQTNKSILPSRPKLVVGIVIDQMAYDFLYRYRDNYSDGGFKKLLNEGFSCENTNYNYIPTYTGPGHASIYTGSVPAIHGIISNDWYDVNSNQIIYCTADTSTNTVGANTTTGKMSPKNELTTTIGDELKLANTMQPKVIGIALKDRSAILPAGHTANAAYWYDGFANAWITSSYYMQNLPQWAIDFNAKNMAMNYLKQNWNLLLPKEKYINSTIDNKPWEGLLAGETAPVFPHILNTAANTDIIKATPYGNSFTLDFAKAAIKGEQLGKDTITDLLCLSFSSTDYVGHTFGPYSTEMEDTYIRLDKDIAALINYLDENIGKQNYVLFLTADHGVAPAPAFSKSQKIPAGLIDKQAFAANMEMQIEKTLGGKNWIQTYMNQQVYLNDSVMNASQKNAEDIFNALKPWLMQQEGIAYTFLIDKAGESTLPDYYKTVFINGIYPKRSGDIEIIFEPGWMEWWATGTTHGSNFSYDTHVPLLWYGWKIPNGKTFRKVNITDVAATISSMLNIREPSGCIGNVIEELK